MSTQTRKKVLLATPLYPPDIGGPATYATMLERFLPLSGVDLTVVAFTPYRRFVKGISHLLYAVALFSHARHAETIFALDPVSVGVPALLVARLLGKKFIIKVVGDYAWEQGVRSGTVTVSLDKYLRTPFSYGWRTSLRAHVERAVASHAQTLIVPSGYLKKVLLTWGIDPSRLVVIPNVALIDRPTESPEALQKILGIGPATLVSAGRLVPWKQFDRIIRIMPEILKKVPNAELCIAGDGPDAEHLVALTHSLQVTENVHFLGRLSTEDLHRYLVASRAFILVSTYEGFSHILIEALALGTPIIASDAGGNTEVLEEGRAGYLVPLNDDGALIRTVEEIFTDQEGVARRVAEGLRSAGRYTPTAHIDCLRTYL